MNKNIGVYSFIISSTDSLYDYILFFFINLPFQSRKIIKFQFGGGGIALHLRKYGSIYLVKCIKLVNIYLSTVINIDIVQILILILNL